MNGFNNPIMDPFQDNSWTDLLDYTNFIDDVATSTDICWSNDQIGGGGGGNCSSGAEVDASLIEVSAQEEEWAEKNCTRKRVRGDSCSKVGGTKACREKLRREKLNERFLELSSVLEPGRPPKTDKLSILGDAIRVMSQLKAESEEHKENNQKLQDEIKTLKSEKNELREEKQVLKEDRDRIEQQLKCVSGSSSSPAGGFMPAAPPLYHHSGVNKMPMYPSYGYLPMWHYLPPSSVDTSQDQHLRPPAA
ncbi:transcription factor bHLH104-like [Impatiens glandulifera]|uniref:transcription factor bHLH104-like n=1 Tax=Impatiens glandulifera TaxID=253017 RepID=UPI001FB0C0C9|nr:transcription factor bHLH104-like [Impatiens glandulifera]